MASRKPKDGERVFELDLDRDAELNYAEFMAGTGELVRVQAGEKLCTAEQGVIEGCLGHPAIREVTG